MEKKKHMKVIRLLSLLLIVRASLMSTKRTTNLFYLWRDLEQSQAGSYVNALYNSAVRLFVLTPLLTLHHQDRVGVFTSALFITPCVHVLTPPIILPSSHSARRPGPPPAKRPPSLWPLSYLSPSITPSLTLSLASLLPRCLLPEIITTSLVKISLYLNSWISKARGCWQSLFNTGVKHWNRK